MQYISLVGFFLIWFLDLDGVLLLGSIKAVL